MSKKYVDPDIGLHYEYEVYPIIKKFDGRVINVDREQGGSFFTCLPISPIGYQADNNLPTYCKIYKMEGFVHFYIRDDWNYEYNIKIHSSMVNEIQEAIEGCKRNFNKLTIMRYNHLIDGL